MRFGFVGILTVSASALPLVAAWAVPQFLPDEYTIICESQKASGFNWKNGNWETTSFAPQKHLIVRSRKNTCLGQPRGEDILTEDVVFRKVCLNVRNFGSPYRILQSHYCTESYHQGDVEIYCTEPAIRLRPDGWFHYAEITDDLRDAPDKDYKDSQVIEVGKCRLQPHQQR